MRTVLLNQTITIMKVICLLLTFALLINFNFAQSKCDNCFFFKNLKPQFLFKVEVNNKFLHALEDKYPEELSIFPDEMEIMKRLADFSNYTFVQLTYFIAKYVDECPPKEIKYITMRRRVDEVRMRKYIPLPDSISILQHKHFNMFSKIDVDLFENYISNDRIFLSEFDFSCLKEYRDKFPLLISRRRKFLEKFYNTQLALRTKIVSYQQQATDVETTEKIRRIFTFKQNFNNYLPASFMLIILLIGIIIYNIKNKTIKSIIENKTIEVEKMTILSEKNISILQLTIFLFGAVICAYLVVILYYYFYSKQKTDTGELNKQMMKIKSRKSLKKASTLPLNSVANESKLELKMSDKLCLPSFSSRATLASLIDVNLKTTKLTESNVEDKKQKETKEIYKKILHENILVKMYRIKKAKKVKKQNLDKL